MDKYCKEVLIKNSYSVDFNMKIIKMAAEKIDIDFDSVIKIIISDRVINFVNKTKKKK